MFLVEIGFEVLTSDPAIYLFQRQGQMVVIVSYVDDILCTGKDERVCREIMGRIHERFRMKGIKEATSIVGMRIRRDRRNRKIHLDATQSILRMLKENGFTAANGQVMETPINHKYGFPSEAGPCDTTAYRSIVGFTMWLAHAYRPDLSYAVSMAAQHSANPNAGNWKGVKQIMRYLRSTADYGLTLGGIEADAPPNLKAYVDADWAGCKDTLRSRSGFVFMLWDSTISYTSKMQTIIARSSTEAEYDAADRAIRQLKWLAELLRELKLDVKYPVVIHEDNQGVINWAEDPVDHKRTKHINMRLLYVRTEVQNGVVKFSKIPTADNVADIFTKALPGLAFAKFRKALGVEQCPF
jgi:hypothetical protein